MFFPPFLFFFVFVFLFVLFTAFALVQFGLFSWAFARLGIPPEQLFSLLFLCIVGSMINIPLKESAWRRNLRICPSFHFSECGSDRPRGAVPVRWSWR